MRKWLIMSAAVVLLILGSPQLVHSQTDDDDRFIKDLAWMAVTGDQMDGVLDGHDLANIQALSDDYYDQAIFFSKQRDPDNQQFIQLLQARKDDLHQKLTQKIAQSAARSNQNEAERFTINLLDSLFRGGSNNPPTIIQRILLGDDNSADGNQNQAGIIHQTITDGANSIDPSEPPEPNPVVSNYQNIQANQLEDHTIHQLNTDIVNQIPDSISVVQSISSSTYDFDAGLPTSSSIAADQDQEDAQPTEPPVPTPTFSTIIQGTPSENGGSGIVLQKPLRFSNQGLFGATVIVESYTPPPDSSAIKSNASTVVFPGGNTSSSLSLPIGEYTFCYYWELDGDADNDGYVDYAHATTGKVTLSATSPDNVENAQVVSLNPENRSSPNGKCGQAVQPPSGSALNLTPQESANQGENFYLCSYEDWGEDSSIFEITFSDSGLTMEGQWLEKVYIAKKIAPNTYISEGDTITFTDDGFLAENDAGVLICTRQ
jgi:hypothetical protein